MDSPSPGDGCQAVCETRQTLDPHGQAQLVQIAVGQVGEIELGLDDRRQRVAFDWLTGRGRRRRSRRRFHFGLRFRFTPDNAVNAEH